MSHHYISLFLALAVTTSLTGLVLYQFYSGQSDVTRSTQYTHGHAMIGLIDRNLLPGTITLEMKTDNNQDKSNIPIPTRLSSQMVHMITTNSSEVQSWKSVKSNSKRVVKMNGTKIKPKMTVMTSTGDLDIFESVHQPRLTKRTRYLVHLCDSTRPCSGWGDRQRGLVSAFLLASVTGRKFLINMTSPCDVRQFLKSSEYNWEISELDPEGKSSAMVGGVSATVYHHMVRTRDLNEIYPHDIIYLRSNSDLINIIKSNPYYKTKVPAWAKASRWESFRNGWDVLMKPRAYIQEKVNTILRHVDLHREGDLVCAHVRLGRNPSLPNDSPNRNSLHSVQVLWRFLEPYIRNSSGVFIASDSMEVRRQARTLFGNKTLDSGGVILHIDRQRHSDEACRGFESAILDQLLLRHCHVLVVSASNFSIRAAHLRGRRDQLFIFKNSKIVSFDIGR